MSTADRKVGFYSFEFLLHRTEDKFFEKDLFTDTLNYINLLEANDKIIRKDSDRKAISIESYNTDISEDGSFINIIFKSCKYNHSPNYMSSLDGAERPSDKQLYEGEKEKTHLVIKVKENEAILVLEERRNGVTITQITEYLNKKLRKHLELINRKKNFKLIYSMVPSENFLNILEDLPRVKIAEVFTHKRILGSESLNLIEREDPAMKQDIMITINTNKQQSLFKTNLKRIYESAVGTGADISRIRIYGCDEEGKSIKLDSDFMKKQEYFETILDNNGIVQSELMLQKMKESLGDD